jgi:HD-like signal output (HDOD) protein
MPASFNSPSGEPGAQAAGNLAKEIRGIGIPPRPSILTEIDAEMRKDEPNFRYLANLIGSDVSLAASLIKIANSPYYGFSKKARSVPDALVTIGLKATLRAIAGLSLQRLFPNVPSLERFWDSAAKTARVSGWMAARLRRHVGSLADEAYTLGLFRDCGIPILMMPFPDYAQILREANEDSAHSFTEIEDRHLSINHAEVGAQLAEDWLLPVEIQQAIRHHHDVDALEGRGQAAISVEARKLIAVCQVSEYLITTITGRSRTYEWQKLGDACWRELGLDDALFAELSEEAVEVVTAD